MLYIQHIRRHGKLAVSTDEIKKNLFKEKWSQSWRAKRAESHPLHTLLPAERSHCGGNSRAQLINPNCEAEGALPCTWLHFQAGSTCYMRKCHSYGLREHVALDHVLTQTRQIFWVCCTFLLSARFVNYNSFLWMFTFCVQLPTMETCIYLEDITLIWIDTSMTSGNLLQVILSYWVEKYM